MKAASRLYALARGISVPVGDHECWYCGESCDDAIPSKDWVKSSCNAHAEARGLGSEYVCAGCAASLAWKTTVAVFGEEIERGTPEHPTKPKPQHVCQYSWVITRDTAVAYTKAHIVELRRCCLNPPQPPFVIVLADSGQKQLLWQSPVCQSRELLVLRLENEIIEYSVCDLAEAISVAGQVAAIVGKPSLSDRLDPRAWASIIEATGDVSVAEKWEELRCTPVGRLAAWLAPSKREQEERDE